MAPIFIYLAGADGTGKSTQASLLLRGLRRLGIPCRHLWLRFPFFSSLPLLAYARWRGYSWHEVHGGVDQGYWQFERSRLLCRVLPLALLVDAALASLFAVYLPLWRGTSIVCERYVLDMLVDLSLATGIQVSDSWPLRSLLKLLPPSALVVGLTAPRQLIVRRRADLEHDHKLGARLSAYEAIFEAIACPVISTAEPIAGVHEEILRLVSAHISP